jgi:hypothetical protein
VKLRFRGTLCSCSFFLIQAAYLNAQEPPPPPAQQTPPTTAPGTPPIPKPTVQMPPSQPQAQTPPPTVSKERDTGGDVVSVEPFIWLVNGRTSIRPGKGVTVSNGGSLSSLGKAKYAEGIVVTFPTTKENSLEFTYFLVKSQTNTLLPVTENFFGNDFASGDALASKTVERGAKISWNYLTFPYPSNGAKFRVKALFEMQYAQISTNFDAPADVNAITTFGSKQIILPSLGLGVEYHPARHVRLEAKASGFALLHRADIWNAEASAVFRIGRLEALLGARAFHDKTSPKQDEYYAQTLYGPYVGLRFIIK